MNKTPIKVWVYWGRFTPIHLGHENTLLTAIQENDIVVVFIGTTALPPLEENQSYKNLIPLHKREYLIKKIFPTISIVHIADTHIKWNIKEDNKAWVNKLDTLIDEIVPGEKNITFYGWCEEDISFFLDEGKNVRIVNRFDGDTSPVISATQVRDYLVWLEHTEPNIEVRKIKLRDKNLVNPLIVDDVVTIFSEEWAKFKKK